MTTSAWARTLREKALALLRQIPAGLTADELAELAGTTVLAMRPRVTELVRLERVFDTGRRRHNASGRTAIVWTADPAGAAPFQAALNV